MSYNNEPTLNDLYSAIESLQKLGLTVDEKLKQETSRLEEDIIRQYVLPILKQKIEPVLRRIKRKLVLAVDYEPGEPLKVSVSHQCPIKDSFDDAVDILPMKRQIVSATEVRRSQTSDLRVRFSDGYVCEGKGKNVLIDALRHMGFQRAAAFEGRTFAGFRLVDRRKRITADNYKWQERVDGWWVYVNMSNDTKKEMIRRVAGFLGIDLEIESGDNKIKNSENAICVKPVVKKQMYSLNGSEPMNKSTCILAAVRRYLIDRPEATFVEIREMFPDSIQGSIGVVRTIEDINESIENGQDIANCYLLNPSEILTSADGIKFAVCSQWDKNFFSFQSHVKDYLGWDLISCK